MAFDIGEPFKNFVSQDGGGSFSLGLLSMGPIGFTDMSSFGGAYDAMWSTGLSTNSYIDSNYDAFDFLNTAIDVVGEHPGEYEIEAPIDANGGTASLTLYDYWNGTATSYYYQDRDTYFSRDFDVDPGNFDNYSPPLQYGFDVYETW